MAIGNKMTKIILGVVIAGLLLGYVFPVGLNAVNEDPTYTITSDESEEVNVQERLNATVTSSDTTTSPDQATIKLEDLQTGTTETQTIENGSSAEYSTLEGGTVNVTVTDVTSGSPNTVTADYTVEQGFAWDDNSQTIFGVLGIFLVIVPLIVLAKIAMRA